MSGPREVKLSSVRPRKTPNRIRPLGGSHSEGNAAKGADAPNPLGVAARRTLSPQLPWPIEMVPLQRLKPAKRNPKTHPEKQIELLVKNIHQFGFTNPALADEKFNVIGGHARAEAAKRAGLSAIPVIIIAGRSEAEKRTLALADNKISEHGGWLRSDLALELSELAPLLQEAGLDLELTGFEAADYDALLGDLVDPERDPTDELPSPLQSDPVSRLGDLWLLGSHRLQCGDATNANYMRELMGGERATMVFTDPPYNVRIRNVQGRGKIKHREFAQASGEMTSAQFTAFLEGTLSLAAEYSVDGSIAFVCMDWRHMGEILQAGKQVYGELKNLVVWTKTNAGQGTFYRSQHELIFVFKNGGAAHINNFLLGKHGRYRSNVWTYAGVNSFRSGRMDELASHPTTKPIAMVVDAIKDCSRRRDIVLDPFMGSGTTILAAERVGRLGFGLEIDPLYVDVAIRRWQTFTKRDAVLASTGQTFDEVTPERSADNSRRPA
jgi:DNA modification methylase